jgi:hypothetical protein
MESSGLFMKPGRDIVQAKADFFLTKGTALFYKSHDPYQSQLTELS